MSNFRFFVCILLLLVFSMLLRNTIWGVEHLFSDAQVSLLSECINFTHIFMRSLSESYTPLTLIFIIAVYLPIQSQVLEKIISIYYPNYLRFLELREEEPSLNIREALAVTDTNVIFVFVWPLFKIFLHISVFYFLIYPLVTLSPAISLDSALIFYMLCFYWSSYLLSNWSQLHKLYLLPTFYFTTVLSVLMVFVFPHGLTFYLVTSAVCESVLSFIKKRVNYRAKEKSPQPTYS